MIPAAALDGRCLQPHESGRPGVISVARWRLSDRSLDEGRGFGSVLNRRTDLRNSWACAANSTLAVEPKRTGRRRAAVARLSSRRRAPGHAPPPPASRSVAFGKSAARVVGDCDLGDHQLIAVWVADTGMNCATCQTSGADCGISLAVAPGASHGVGDDHGDGDAEPLAQPARRLRRTGFQDRPAAALLGPTLDYVHARRDSRVDSINVRSRAPTRALPQISIGCGASRSLCSVFGEPAGPRIWACAACLDVTVA